jgi:filamentous hemagglutinin family protein
VLKTKSYLAILTLICLTCSSAQAQTYTPSNRVPVADPTLGTQVSGSNNNFNITGGVSKGQTTFHSFTDFSVPTNGQANFTNPAGNRDIITRVTGTTFSDINGLVNTNGANFFLINPNGITFGTGARLNVGKAFVGSTANGINLVDGSGRAITFGTNSAGDAPLLSVSPNVLFNVSSLTIGAGSQPINNFGTLQTTNASQYIGLIGGDVNFNGGKIFAPGGRVDIGGLTSSGTVSVNSEGLVFGGNNLSRSSVTITNGSSVSVRANQTLTPVDPAFFANATAPGSSINISANRIEVSKSGERFKSSPNDGQINQAFGGLDAGLDVNSGTKTETIGNISLNATGDILIQRAAIFNLVRSGAQGSETPGGGIKIVGNNITVTDKSEISTNLSENAVGRGGDIDIRALGNFNLVEPPTPDATQLEPYAASVIAASTYGRGNSGKVKISVRGNAIISDSNAIASTVEASGSGNSSGIEIDAGLLKVFNGSQILTAAAASPTNQTGNAGNIDIRTTGEIVIFGTKAPAAFSNIFDRSNALAIVASSNFRAGNAGKVTLTTPGKLSVSNRGAIWSQIRENGNGTSGGIQISAGELVLSNLSEISSSLGTYNQFGNPNPRGTAGDISIKTTGNITIDEDRQIAVVETPNNFAPSAIFSSVFGTGTGGKITIETPGKLTVGNRDLIGSTVEPSGQGNSNGIKINAGELVVFNQGQILSFATGTENNRSGNAGNIDIKTTGNITVAGNNNPAAIGDGSPQFLSKISSSSYRNGTAGKITLDAGGTISLLNRGGIITERKTDAIAAGSGDITIKGKQLNLDRGNISVEATADGGNLKIVTQDGISIRNNSNISTSATNGKAGDISLTSPQITLDASKINARSNSGKGGNIQVSGADLLLLRRGAQISAEAGGTAQAGDDGGNITIDSKLLVALAAENSDITANAVRGNGGIVTINAQAIFGFGSLQPADSNITANSVFGQTGTVNINTPGLDPGKNTTELPTVPTDASTQISQVCGASNRQNKLTVTGRGGLPATATELLTTDVIWQDDRSRISATNNTPTNPVKLAPPAVGLVFDGKGKVSLVAAGAERQPIGTNVACPPTKQK